MSSVIHKLDDMSVHTGFVPFVANTLPSLLFWSGSIKVLDHDMVLPSVVKTEYTEGSGTKFNVSQALVVPSSLRYLSPLPVYVGNGVFHNTASSSELTCKNSRACAVLAGSPIALSTSFHLRPVVSAESTVKILPAFPAFAGNSEGVRLHFALVPSV